nr:glycosyltransferase family 4 protein [Chloroflexota bacterium]
MKIVLFDYIFERGRPGITGLSDLVWNWAKHLVALGDEVHIVAPPYPKGAKPPKGALMHFFPVPPMGYRNIAGRMLTVLRGWLDIRRLGRVDIIHVPEYLATAIFAFLSNGTPVILTTPGNIFERIENINEFDWLTTQVYKVAARLSAKYCACIIATSAEMQKWWVISGASPERVVQIPLGVDTNVFQPISGARAELGWGDSPSVLFVGRLQKENGAEYLIEAMGSIAKDIPDVVLHIVGSGPDLHKLQEVVQHADLTNQVQWHGPVALERLPLFYSATDVFVLPRLSRVTPRVLFEAMACQVPVITSAIGGIGEFVDDGVTGFTIDPRNPSAIAQRIIQILRDAALANRMRKAAREFACRELDWSVIVRRMRTEVYQRFV